MCPFSPSTHVGGRQCSKLKASQGYTARSCLQEKREMRKRRKEKEEKKKEENQTQSQWDASVGKGTKLDYLRLFRVHTAERRRAKLSRCLLTLCVHAHTHTVNQELWNKSGEDSGKTTEVSSGAVTVLFWKVKVRRSFRNPPYLHPLQPAERSQAEVGKKEEKTAWTSPSLLLTTEN